jgi:hypothetical protein
MGDAAATAIDAWNVAGRALSIEVVAPATFELDGQQYACVAWLPDFGGGNGTLVAAMKHGWQPQQIIVDPDVTPLPDGQLRVFVRIVVQDSVYQFVYLHSAAGIGKLNPRI